MQRKSSGFMTFASFATPVQYLWRVDRRVFFAAVAAGVLAASGAVVGGYAAANGFAGAASGPKPTRTPLPTPRGIPATPEPPGKLPAHFFPPKITKVALPSGSIGSLPGKGNALALTVDDGSSSEVIRLYAEFAKRTGMRITFFINGSYSGWTENAAILRPLIESGQVQIGNHTWSHANLQKLSDKGIVDELQRNHDFIQKTLGTDAKPYFRPPYGYHDSHVDSVARSIGYSTPVLWYGTLSDSADLTDDQFRDFADQWILAQHIVIGHANYPAVTHNFDFLADLIKSRDLQPVTLNDYFSR